MEPEQEIREILGHLKELLSVHEDMGLDPPPVPKTVEPGPSITDENRAEALGALREEISDCRRCKLHKARRHIVFGEGNPEARLVFVGEGPGRDEDLVGRPFVGEAGRLLTDIIQKGMRLKREEVYICNVVKCRPPKNRDPEKDEIEACIPFLKQQIRIIRPKAICILGRIAAQALLKPDFKISRERGTWFSFEGIPVMPTYHPAYIVRNRGRERELKRAVWEDIKEIMRLLGLEIKDNA